MKRSRVLWLIALCSFALINGGPGGFAVRGTLAAASGPASNLVTPRPVGDEVAARIQRVENGLLPAVLIKGQTRPMNLADRMAYYKIPGVSVAVINNGRLEWARGFGVKEAGSPDPVTPETLFQAGSISKPVAALAALSLVQSGKLDLDEDVNIKLKSWKVPDNQFTKEKKVTLRELLSHSAGMTVHGFPGYDSGGPVASLIQVLDGVKPPANTPAIRVDMLPGTKWRYSGGGYTVMQQLLIDVTGKPFPQILRELVFNKIGLEHSTYEQPLPPGRAAAAATAHLKGEKLHGKWHIYPEMAAAGLWTTPSDLALVAIEMQKSLAGQSNKILSAAMAKQMVTVQMQSWGLGFSLESNGESARFGHGGVDEGFEAQFIAYNSRGQGAVVMTNGNRGSAVAAEIMRGIAREYGWPDYLPAERELARVDPAGFAAYEGKYDMAGRFMINIRKDGDKLVAWPDGDEKIDLVPESDGKFLLIDVVAEVVFVKDPDGRVSGIVLRQGGQELKGKRVQ